MLNATPLSMALTDLLVKLMEDALAESSYDAQLAGLSSGVAASGDSLTLALFGFCDKIQVILDQSLEVLLELPNLNQAFDRVKDDLVRHYKNWDMDAPYQHAMDTVRCALEETQWTPYDKLKAIGPITPADIQAHVKALQAQFWMETYLLGNDPGQAKYIQMMQDVVSKLQPRTPLSNIHRFPRRAICVPTGSTRSVRSGPNPANVNSAVDLYLQLGPIHVTRSRVLTGLLIELIKEPAFHILRTRRQLGYLVYTDLHRQAGQLGLRVLVQSERAHPTVVETCMESFLEECKSKVDRLKSEPERFDALRAMYIAKVLERSKNMYEKASRMWSCVTMETYDFDYKKKLVEGAKEIQAEDLIEFYYKYVAPNAPERRKFVAHIVAHNAPLESAANQIEGEKEDPLIAPPGPTPNVITDLCEWRSQQPLMPVHFVKL
jgi:insulysin